MSHAASKTLAFEGLSLGYDRTPALRGIETRIEAGALTAVIGPNGAGKSTLLKGVTGALAPLAGRVRLEGFSRRDIAFLPQQSQLDRSFPIPVAELVSMGLWRRLGAFGRLGRRGRAQVEDALAAVGLTGFETRSIEALSGGQMQRALFARLLLQDAQLVLLDEPFTAVDARTMVDLLGLIARWHGEGRTVLAVLHDHDMVRAHFPEAMLLARGLIAHGPTDQVLTPANQLRARAMCEACDGPPHSCGRPSPGLRRPAADGAEPLASTPAAPPVAANPEDWRAA